MDNLARFDSEGIEIFVNELTGESFASISALARMTGKAASTIQRLAALRNFELQDTQIETATGKKTVALLDENQIVEVLEKYNTQQLKQFAKLGIRNALHKISGYQEAGFSHSKPKSLLDLSPTQLYQLAAYQLSIEFDKTPNRELIEGIDPTYLAATSDAAFYAYHRATCEIAKQTKRANDVLRDIGWIANNEKAKKKEQKDIAEFAKYAEDLDRSTGKQHFDRFEAQQVALAGSQNLALQGT
jgi:hypothetical protein